MRYWPVLITALILAALFAPFGFAPLPWRSWQYFGAALLTLALLTLIFVRRRRSRTA